MQSGVSYHPSQRVQNHLEPVDGPEINYLVDLILFSSLHCFGEIEKVSLSVDEYLLNLENALFNLGLEQPLKAEYRLYQIDEKGFLVIKPDNTIRLSPAGRRAGKINFTRLLEIAGEIFDNRNRNRKVYPCLERSSNGYY